MRILAFFAAFLIALPMQALADYRDRSIPIAAQADLNLQKYLGKWYEIARFPNRFEKGCVGVTAEYSMRPDGKVKVLNTCRQGSLDGRIEQAEGQASVVGPGKLSVTFVPWLPFARGDYWVLFVDRDYRLAVVGAPKGKTGWVLARSPKISQSAYAKALKVLQQNGYDTDAIMLVEQGD